MDITKEQALIFVGALIVLAYAYKRGAFVDPDKKGANLDPAEAAAKGDQSEVTLSRAEAKNAAISFRDGLLENSFSGEIFQSSVRNLLELSDADFVFVSNTYNNLFVNKTFKTLRALILQENIWYTESQRLRDQFINRLNALNL